MESNEDKCHITEFELRKTRPRMEYKIGRMPIKTSKQEKDLAAIIVETMSVQLVNMKVAFK